MTKITTNQVREKYLNHFAKHGHVIVPSSRLVPENDPTTLFTGSGMQPMVPYLLGQKHPLGTRIADSQKCFRSQDIEEVGDNRHTTFFEMLGNWSLGDYFKEEQITWMWEFIINEIKVDPKNLYVTCFKGAPEIGAPMDTISAELWQKLFSSVGTEAKIGQNPEVDGMKPGEKIFYFPAKKNWWSRAGVPQNMPVGEPGGPDSEMFYDFDPDLKNNFHAKSYFKNDPCHPNCDCGRFMEIGNNVFMEYVKTENGFEKLPAPNVDHGSGLERFVAAANNDNDVFNIDVFDSAKKKIEELSGKKYNPISDDKEILGVDKGTQAFRVILDHLRGATFFIADGIFPGNKDQGYFVRRLLRRAIRNGKNLGIEGNFCAKIAEVYINYFKEVYSELKENESKVYEIMTEEETKFNKTLLNGEKEFYNIVNQMPGFKKSPETFSQPLVLSGELAFTLYESYGFPVEIIEDLCKENGLGFDKKGFEDARAKHSEMSRAGSEQKFKGGLADNSEMVVKYHTATHLLHQALKNVLGETANQKGSNITGERLRFDFSHDKKMTPEEIQKTEQLVNEWIQKDLTVRREEMNKQEAEERKPIHLFGEKYGDVVSIYTIGDGKVRGVDATSVEFCGGPHVEHTGQIGEGNKKFKIVKEEAVSAGVRRIKAVVE
jgi:alanyl-tRNA synthetase